MDVKNWEKGLGKELGFWREWTKRKKGQYSGRRRLSSLFDFMMVDKKEVVIANLGAGAINLIGDCRRDIKVKVISSDFLANEYNKIWDEMGVKIDDTIEYQDMTKLTYSDKTFDIVFCANALDHCVDPKKAIREMLRVCKDDGWVYLSHICHEGKRQGYKGLHQWNLDITENGDCYFCTKRHEEHFLLSEIHKGFVNSVKKFSKGSFLTSYSRKLWNMTI